MGRALLLACLNISGPCHVGRYGEHLSNLEQVGVEALRRAIRQPEVSVVVIDEIGKMRADPGLAAARSQGESARRATRDGENAPLDA